MKKKINWWAIAAIVIIGVAVGYVAMGIVNKKKPVPDPDERYLTISPDRLSFESGGGEEHFTIDSNTKWDLSVDEDQNWLSVSQESGNGKETVTVTAEENTEDTERTASIRVTWTNSDDEEEETVISIEQEKAEAINPTPTPNPTPNPDPVPVTPSNYLSLSPSSVSFAANGGSKSVTVNSNTDWEVAVAGGDGWLSVSPVEGNGRKNITLKATGNAATDRRTATLKFTWKDDRGSSRSNTLSVTQTGTTPPLPPAPIYLRVTPANVSFTANGGSKAVSVSSNTEWEVSSTGGGDWLTVNMTGGNRNKSVSLKASSNTATDGRTASLKFTWRDENGTAQSRTIGVSQSGITPPNLYLRVTPEKVSFGTNGGNKNITINSNTDWNVSVTGGDGWLTVSTVEGNGTKRITLRTIKNEVDSRREAILRISWKDGQGNPHSNEVSVEQEKGSVSPPPVGLSLTKEKAQSILSSGQRNVKVPDGCTVIVNGKTMNYQTFRNGVKLKTYTNIVVSDNPRCDEQGNATFIRVNATVAEE